MNNDGEHGYYSRVLHPKVIAFKEHINRLTGDLDTKKMKLVVKIPLPSEGEFILTPSSVSGHSVVFPISCNEVDAPGNESDSEVFILMFDLMEKKKKKTTHTSGVSEEEEPRKHHLNVGLISLSKMYQNLF